MAFGLIRTPAQAAEAESDRPVLELRVMTYAALIPADLALARQTAIALLETAGLQVAWRECQGDSCAGPPEGWRVLVHLLPIAKMADPTASGDLVRDSARNLAAVLVYVPRNEEVTRAIRQSSAGRSHPALFSLSTGHVIGLTIAHEVGHWLGLPHVRSGPMKARLEPEDFLALRMSLLRFPRVAPQSRNADKSATIPAPSAVAKVLKNK